MTGKQSPSKSNKVDVKVNKGKPQNQAGKQPQIQQKSQQLPVIPNKDFLHRINYSYQAAIFLQNLGEVSGSGSKTKTEPQTTRNKSTEVRVKIDRKGKNKAVEVDVDGGSVNAGDEERARAFRRLARTGMKDMRGMSVHNQLKLDPSLKRSICATCSAVLIPGLSSRIRNRPSRNTINKSNTTCLTCLTTLSIPTPPIATLSRSEHGLDGPIRSAKRKKAMKRGKIAFHNVEKGEIGLSADDGPVVRQGEKSHVMWKGDEKVVGWGVMSTLVGSTAGDENTTPPE
ncbi:hypothetical protein IAR55_002501 [Kwoniella newhampshirensis]|uniref:Uncharacterized protein n=1 Tax=Kwoniella newhampshirensis TaxID=1651941 RepID=A0AAW0Z1M0_9TREE